MRRRDGYDPTYDDPWSGPRRRRGIGAPFGLLGGGRRGYGPVGAGYGRGYRRGGGGGCARDLCLLEGGCCLAESLDGSCLVLAVLALPQLLVALVHRPAGLGPGQGVLLALVRTYQQQVSARRARPVCRFSPTCSAYAVQAVTRYGALRGAGLTARRLVRCRPGAVGGPDPVA